MPIYKMNIKKIRVCNASSISALITNPLLKIQQTRNRRKSLYLIIYLVFQSEQTILHKHPARFYVYVG